MGALHLASETIAGHRRLVVIKEMLEYYDPAEPGSQSKAARRFEAEAATLAALSVPGVPQVFDFFVEGGRYFIVMQFIEGQNLELGLTHLDERGNIVRGKPYPAQDVRQWGSRICKILETIATKNIIHMDIKPANLILDPAGEIWLVDFGTSKAHVFTPIQGQTGIKKSSVFGTLGYAPPEQAKGKPETRSDVFALAATLYHLLTDDDPRDEPYKFSQLKRVPGDIRIALKKALETDVKQRISAREFRRFLENKQGSAPVFKWRDGSVSYSPEDLVPQADRNWEEARIYFKGGEWRSWFRDLHRNDILAQMEQIQRMETNPDLALDSFLRSLDPALPQPVLKVLTTNLDAGEISWGKQQSLELEIVNQGSGCLQANLRNLPTGLQVHPIQFATRDSQRVNLIVDAEILSPSAQPQVLTLTIDAGHAGQEQVQITVTVPEPVIQVSPSRIKLKRSSDLDPNEHTLTIRNQGGSPCVIHLSANVPWIRIDPRRFLCSPGKPYQVSISGKSNDQSFNKMLAEITLTAAADKWEDTQHIPLAGSISLDQFIRVRWVRQFLWMAGWFAYGLFFGALLGIWSGGIEISGAAYAVLTGILFGTLICVLLPVFIGALGGLGSFRGRAGARMGALLGIGPGVIVGGLMGWLGYQLLNLVGIPLDTGLGMGFFGALVGAASCLALGLVTWRVGGRWDGNV